MYSRNWVAFCG